MGPLFLLFSCLYFFQKITISLKKSFKFFLFPFALFLKKKSFFFLFFFCKSGKPRKTYNALCTVDDASSFLAIRLGPKTSVCEKHVSVKSTVSGCDVTNCGTTSQGFNKHASSRREAVSDSPGVPRCTEKISKKCTLAHMCRSFDSQSSPLYHLPGELVSIRSVPIPSIDLSLWNRSRPSAFVPISLGFTSVLTDDIVRSFRKTKS